MCVEYIRILQTFFFIIRVFSDAFELPTLCVIGNLQSSLVQVQKNAFLIDVTVIELSDYPTSAINLRLLPITGTVPGGLIDDDEESD